MKLWKISMRKSKYAYKFDILYKDGNSNQLEIDKVLNN